MKKIKGNCKQIYNQHILQMESQGDGETRGGGDIKQKSSSEVTDGGADGKQGSDDKTKPKNEGG